ncbi:TPA: hypothetical protein N0F65_011871 [Lagenidium giganteum]|uniref:Uncharacterized protein n=1 Tax=Lagenidium giganteum TaxID=4803 RepID=A0AAV2YGU9_9STRA|nr:TPA: hypothetical protein N0F65_011871 [Lagenidium giganteum]
MATTNATANATATREDREVKALPTEQNLRPRSNSNSALQTTLGMASTAASMVLYPYVAAGKAAYQVTSFAVTAPINITRRVTSSISSSWQGEGAGDHAGEQEQERDEAAAPDLFGESGTESSSEAGEGACDLSAESHAAVDGAVAVEDAASAVEVVAADNADAPADGVVSQLLSAPRRIVTGSVSAAAAVPTAVITYGGRTISGAGGTVARTSRRVAWGITTGVFSTASYTATTCAGLVGSSVRTASNAIPPSVSAAVWQGIEKTGTVSTHVASYALAVPLYRLLSTVVPDIAQHVTEDDCVNRTKDVVTLLVKVLGPQNAFYVLKFAYETLNSDEAYDLLVLCRDVARESIDAENYRRAGAAISESSGLATVVPVVKGVYSLLPSTDELLDVVSLVGDISHEVATQLSSNDAFGLYQDGDSDFNDQTTRFEYLDEDTDASDSDDTSPPPAVVVDEGFSSNDGFSVGWDNDDDFEEEVSFSSAGRGLVDMGVSLFASVCESEEASTLFNTLGDFLDVLVE